MEIASNMIIVTGWLAMLVSVVDIVLLVFVGCIFSKMVHAVIEYKEKSESTKNSDK